MFQDHPDAEARRSQLLAIQREVERQAAEAADVVLASTNPEADAKRFILVFLGVLSEGFGDAQSAAGRTLRRLQAIAEDKAA